MAPQLDPAAVEAAAKAYWINATGRNDTRGSMAWSEQSDVLQTTIRDTITSNITAYIAAIEDDLRERVETLENAAITYGRNGDGGDACPEFEAMDDAQAAVYALFGLEAER